jgi:hypothetical protein
MAKQKTITMCKILKKKKAKHEFLPLHVRLYDAICALKSVTKGQRPASLRTFGSIGHRPMFGDRCIYPRLPPLSEEGYSWIES